jgi:hypothetical protein
VIGDCISGNAVKPRDERCAAPFELSDVCESLLKDVRREVLCFSSILNPALNVCVHTMEVQFIKLRKAARILLSSLN